MTKVCTIDDLEIDQGKEFTVEGVEIALWRRPDGKVHALSAICTHAEVPLAEGEIVDNTVECWAHCATFDLETGAATMPATTPATVYPVTLIGNDVLVDVASV